MVGYTTPSKRFVVKHGGDVMADLPIKELGDEAPLYDRPHVASDAVAGGAGARGQAADRHFGRRWRS